MNGLLLFIRGIKASIKNDPLIHIIFAFFYILTVLVCIYVVGKFSANVSQQNYYDNSLTLFTVNYGGLSETKLSDVYESVNKYIDDENVEYIEITFLDDFSYYDDTDEDSYYTKDTVPHYATCYAKNEAEMVSQYLSEAGMDNIDIDEFISSQDEAVVVEDESNRSEGDFYDIQGNSYKIIGRVQRGKNNIIYHLTSTIPR